MIDGRSSKLLYNQRTKNNLLFLTGAVLIFCAAMVIMYCAMR